MMKHQDAGTVDEMLARRVAGETLADVRTVRKVLRGEAVRGVVAERIREAIAARRATDSKS